MLVHVAGCRERRSVPASRDEGPGRDCAHVSAKRGRRSRADTPNAPRRPPSIRTRAVEWAAREAALRETTLRIVSVPVTWPDAGPLGKFSYLISHEMVADAARQDAGRALADAAGRAAWLVPGLQVDTAIIDGPPAQALLGAAADASMLVVGFRGAGGFAGMMLGPVSRYAATHAPCPVVVTREEAVAAHREIVVGVRDLEHLTASWWPGRSPGG
jgi:nucleotide-binding universal stress UspA family protein